MKTVPHNLNTGKHFPHNVPIPIRVGNGIRRFVKDKVGSERIGTAAGEFAACGRVRIDAGAGAFANLPVEVRHRLRRVNQLKRLIHQRANLLRSLLLFNLAKGKNEKGKTPMREKTEDILRLRISMRERVNETERRLGLLRIIKFD